MADADEPAMQMACDGPVVVLCWTGVLTLAGVRVLHARMLETQARHPEGLAVVHVTSRTRSLTALGDDAYAELMKIVDDGRLQVVSIGAVLRTEGIGAAIVRAGLSTAMLLARRASKYRCASTVDEIDRWLDRGPAGLLPGFRHGAVARALESLRAPLGARAEEFLDPPRARRPG